jgi:hypothetical protein
MTRGLSSTHLLLERRHLPLQANDAEGLGILSVLALHDELEVLRKCGERMIPISRAFFLLQALALRTLPWARYATRWPSSVRSSGASRTEAARTLATSKASTTARCISSRERFSRTHAQ